MTIMQLFFQAKDPAANTPDAARRCGFVDSGCLGSCIYLVEHPSLLVRDAEDASHSNDTDGGGNKRLLRRVFSCTADLGTIGKGRRFESGGQVNGDTLSMCGADSLLLSGQYWSDTTNVADEDDAPESAVLPPSKSMVARPKRFFAMLDANRLSDVAVWPLRSGSSQADRLHRLPNDVFFMICDGPVLATAASDDGVRSLHATATASDAAIWGSSRGPWFTKSIAWVLVKERLAADIKLHAQRIRSRNAGGTGGMPMTEPPPLSPSFHVIAARVALGTIDATGGDGTGSSTPSSRQADTRLRVVEYVDTPFADKWCLDSVMPSQGAKGTSKEGDLVMALRHALLYKQRSATADHPAAAMPTTACGYELLGLHRWQHQCMPLQLPGEGEPPPPLHGGVRLNAYAFLLMCHPVKSALSDHRYFSAVNNLFLMAKKKYGTMRPIGRFGIGHVIAAQQIHMWEYEAESTAAADPQRQTGSQPSMPTVLVDGPQQRADDPPDRATIDRGAASTGTQALPPTAAVVGASAVASLPATGNTTTRAGGRELVVLWDIDSVKPKNPLAHIKAFLRVLSIQDLHEQWGNKVSVHVYLDSASFVDAAALLQPLVREIDCILHPVPHRRENSNSQHTIVQLLSDAEAWLGIWSAGGPSLHGCPQKGVLAILTDHTSHPVLASICTRHWGPSVEGLVLCSSDTTASMLSWHDLHNGRDAEPLVKGGGSDGPCNLRETTSEGQQPYATRLLLLEANLETTTFATVAEASAQQKRSTHDSKLTPRRSIILGPVPDERPPEITIAEVALLDTNNGALSSRGQHARTTNLADKPYAHLLVPLMHMLWELQRHHESVDILLRELFACIRDRMEHMGIPPAGTELLYSAFHTLVNRGWLKPGFGKKFNGRVFQRAVCWTCFASNIPRDDGVGRGGSPTHPILMPPLPMEALTSEPLAGDATPQTGGRSTPLMGTSEGTNDGSQNPASGGFAHMQITDDDDDDILTLIAIEPPLHERTDSHDALADDPFSTATLTVPRRMSSVRVADTHDTIYATGAPPPPVTGPVVVPLSLLDVSDLLDTFSLDVCSLQGTRQWMPTELLVAKQEGRVDHLRVLIALMTLQRQHGTLGVSMWSLLDRCVTLERIVLCMQGDVSHGGGGSEDSYAARYTAISGIPGGVAVSRLNRDVFVQDIEAAIATRVVARLSDGSLCFVSDVHFSSMTAAGDESLIAAVCNGCQPSAPRSPPELSHIFTVQSLHRLLMARALRDEQYVVFPQLAVHMRKVRVRWHELCVRHGLVPSAPLWESVRVQMERACMVHVFTVPSSQFTWMMFWSDATAIRFVLCCANGSDSSKRKGIVPTSTAQVPLQPFFASCIDSDTRLCLPSHPYELLRESFRRDVQLFPRELMFAVQQDSLNEHYLLMLHALQKLQRSVVVDAIVCDYLVARFLLQSPSGALLEQHPPTSSLPASKSKAMLGGVPPFGGDGANSKSTPGSSSSSNNVWSRVMETQSILAGHRLVYVSGSDIAFGSDYIHHVPHFARVSKHPRQNLLEQDPVELQHDAAILDPGVRLLLDGLMHTQRLLRKTKVSWAPLAKVLAQQLPASDRVDDVLERCVHAGLVRTIGAPMHTTQQGGSSRWVGASICFTSDAHGVGLQDALPPPPPMPAPVPPMIAQEAASVPLSPPPYAAQRVVYPSTKPLNPLSKPFEVSNTGSGVLSAMAPPPTDASIPGSQQLPASVALLEGLIGPAVPSQRPVAAPTDQPPTSADGSGGGAIVPLSALSRRSRVVGRSDASKASAASKSVLSQLFLTLERLEGRPSTTTDEEHTSCGSSARGPTPGAPIPTPAATLASPTSPAPQGTASTGPGSRFISALTWLFESALEEVSLGPKSKNAAASPHHGGATGGGGGGAGDSLRFASEDEQSRQRRLYYSTLAAFFDTAANGENGVAANETEGGDMHLVGGDEGDDDDDDDGLVWRQVKRRPINRDQAASSTDTTAQPHGDGIVVPCRNRPQLSHAQKRAMRQLHAKLTQASMTENCQDAEPWESVKFFFAKAEVIAGIAL